MHVGMALHFQNLGRPISDQEMYQNELRLAARAEPLGFDSLWAVEHHFTDYVLIPDPVELLAYLAGQTSQIELGTMVVVLPWHDPIRVAEQISMLDNLSNGRVVFGIGRGLGRVEFEGFGASMDESRERFVEAAEMILSSLEDGHMEHDGKFYKQVRRAVRPEPTRSFRGRTYAAAVSPESGALMAQLGVGILVIPQKPWDRVAADLEDYRAVYREVNATEAPAPACASYVFCDPDPVRAAEMASTYIGGYYQSCIDHYGLNSTQFAGTKGYEYYDKVVSGRVSTDGDLAACKFFTDLHVWGTPEQCIEKAMWIQKTLGASRFMGVFSYAGLPYDEAERSLDLFTSEVMPALKEYEPALAAAG
jgi:alkanesulfonate monooxygenase SsuD/methylene tetrahydromethanopterin reductase-like flavin-dependent oxidoreductase (luciferase family)